jgi:hypothetical protein
MHVTSYARSWSINKRNSRQKGQALIYGLFVLMGGVAALFFLFNTGQISSEKTKLVNTADAVAYSAGVMHARTLNFEAYTNRAMLANTVAIAQLVSLASWVQYTDNLANYGYAAQSPQFELFAPSMDWAQQSGPDLKKALIDSEVLEKLAKASDKIIVDILMNSQKAAYEGLVLARKDVMQQVADANYLNDGAVIVDAVPLTKNEFRDFSSRYTGDDRTRFADTSRIAAKRDGFVNRRDWVLPATYMVACYELDFITRAGGTELIGFDQWKALDTLETKTWSLDWWGDCVLSPTPAGWGAQTAATSDGSAYDWDPLHYGYSMLINTAATGTAQLMAGSDWDYSGIPSFYDLSDAVLNNSNDAEKNDPRLKFAIRVRRNVNQARTSEADSAIKSSTSPSHTPGLNAYQAKPAGGSELVAVGASEVFFQRPDGDKENAYGKDLNKPTEIGSLFNPYWQVHLLNTDPYIAAAVALQAAGAP